MELYQIEYSSIKKVTVYRTCSQGIEEIIQSIISTDKLSPIKEISIKVINVPEAQSGAPLQQNTYTTIFQWTPETELTLISALGTAFYH